MMRELYRIKILGYAERYGGHIVNITTEKSVRVRLTEPQHAALPTHHVRDIAWALLHTVVPETIADEAEYLGRDEKERLFFTVEVRI